jgi:hypothetical protein
MTHHTDTVEKTPVADDPQARALLHNATERSYRLPSDFPGFAAQIAVQIDADTWTGSVEGRTPQSITVTLAGTAPDAASKWARKELSSIIGHRWPTPFAQRDGRYTLTADMTPHPLGTRIDLHGDPLRSHYRVRDGQIRLVHRTMGEQSFTITMLGHTHLPDGRTLPAQFVVVFRAAEGKALLRTDAYIDTFTDVAGCWLPECRQIVHADQAGMRVSTMTLHDHRLLDGGAS